MDLTTPMLIFSAIATLIAVSAVALFNPKYKRMIYEGKQGQKIQGAHCSAVSALGREWKNCRVRKTLDDEKPAGSCSRAHTCSAKSMQKHIV